MTIYEDSRVVSRNDLAAWLRQLAIQLESDGRVFFGAGGKVAVADQVQCEFEIEKANDSEMSVEIEFTWPVQEAAGPAAASAEPEVPGDDSTDAGTD